MRFLDLQTGHTFEALWSEGQTKGYTFWFPEEQSIDITYVMPICMLTDNDTPITLEMEDNEVFSFITSTENEIVGGFEFGTPEYFNTMTTEAEDLGNGMFAHIFYVSASSSVASECTEFINIDGYGGIRIGADFYGENESLYINLSNNGVEIPETIQKTIYDSNVHEDYKDNILLNRKFKELMSNYWNVVANRGSYKSLVNSLKWFEWGDILRIREMWKRDCAGKDRFDDREMCSLLEDKYIDTINDFNRTTYLSLFAATQQDGWTNTVDEDGNEVRQELYDGEHNPVLQSVSMKWSREDMSLKLSLLAEFFGTFFMPIHMSIFHACVEDRIYTNTIKALSGMMNARYDMFADFGHVDCNITDGQTFRIDNVRAQVTRDTVFGVTTDMDTKHTHFGVDRFPSEGMVDEESLPTFATQYYTGPGVIIPIRLTLNTLSKREFVKYVSVTFSPDGKDNRDTIVFHDRFYTRAGRLTIPSAERVNMVNELLRRLNEYDRDIPFDVIVENLNDIATDDIKQEFVRRFQSVVDYKCECGHGNVVIGEQTLNKTITRIEFVDWANDTMYPIGHKIDIKFNLLSKIARDYDMVFTFVLSSSKSITRRLQFSTIDVDNLNLSVYKIKSKDDTDGFSYDDFYSAEMNDYYFKLQNTTPTTYKQYLPYVPNPDEGYDGVKLNRTVVIDVRGKNYEIPRLTLRMSPYLSFKKTDPDGTISQLIFVSKRFNETLPSYVTDNYKILRNELGFYPQFHRVERLEGNTIEDYTISQYDAICVIPEIHKGGNTYERFRYGHLIKDAEWEFINNSVNDTITHPASARTPIVSERKNELIKDGFYDIVFRYRLSDEDRELRLDSAFRKKTV